MFSPLVSAPFELEAAVAVVARWLTTLANSIELEWLRKTSMALDGVLISAFVCLKTSIESVLSNAISDERKEEEDEAKHPLCIYSLRM